jgi:hypothetical protein
MKTASSKISHRFENEIGLFFSSIDALKANIEDHDFLKRVIEEMFVKKEKAAPFLKEVKEILGGHNEN